MSENPYAAPEAKIVESSIEPKSLYSPGQVTAGTIFGGPFAAIYLLYANFTALQQLSRAKLTFILGFLIAGLFFVLAVFLPENIPALPFTLVQVFIASFIAGKYQKSKKEIESSSDFKFHSNWRVLWISIGMFIATVAAAFLVLYMAIEYFELSV